MNEEWKSCVQGKPTNDGKYYVYISNLQVGDELRIMSYEKIIGIVCWNQMKE